MVSNAALTDHSAVERAMADFDGLGRELFLLKHGFPETNEAFVITGSGRYDVRALFAAAFEQQHEVALSPKQVTKAAAGEFSALGYVVTASSDQKDRRRFRTLDEALAHFPVPQENLPIIRDFVAVREYAEFHIPASRAYIGMKPRSGQPAHYVSTGQIVYREVDGRLRSIQLPVASFPRSVRPAATLKSTAPRAPRASAAVRATPAPKPVERVESFCPECFLVLPATGICANCD